APTKSRLATANDSRCGLAAINRAAFEQPSDRRSIMSTASQYLHRVGLTLAVVIGLPASLSAAPPAAEPANTTPAASATPTQEELFKQFEEKLSGAQLVGYFTESGKESDNPLKADKYTIEKV